MLAALLVLLPSLSPQAPLQIELSLRGKEPISATWSVTSVVVDTDFGSATVKASRLAQIRFGSPDVVLTDSGTELRGELRSRNLDVKVDGKPRRIAGGDVVLLVVVRDGKPLGLPRFDGEWMTTFGVARLAQRGASVTGEYGYQGAGRIEGTIEDGALAFTYREESGSGAGRWTLSDGGDVFTGRFGSGGKGQGFWGGYRKQPAVAAAKPGEVATGQTGAGLRYHVRLPKAHGNGRRWPGVCILHGSNMDSRSYVDTIVATWPELAEQCVLVGLDGERLSEASQPGAPRFNYTYVNFSGEKGFAWARRQSPALVAESLQQLGKELPVAKWYVGGHSQGGFLTWCMVMYYPELLAGAFPMSCNLLVQCEPDAFEPQETEKQHEVAIAVVHGRKDRTVEFSGGEYCHLRAVDGGFPRVRLFAPEQVGHQFALLPVADAVRWLWQCTSDDPRELAAFATASADDGGWRDAGAALQRLGKLPADPALAPAVAALQKRQEEAAGPPAQRLAAAIAAAKDGRWVDDFLRFRAVHGNAPQAAPVLAAYAALRERQRSKADELFAKLRSLRDASAREPVSREILDTCYATKWYEVVKLWQK